MHQSFQLALNFNDSQLDNTPVSEILPEIPIDKYFPEDEANKLAAFESYNKHLYRPNTYLHKWWARRSGREKVALISFGYQNIFATRLSFDSGKIS